MTDSESPLIILRHCVDFPSKQAYAVQMALAAYALADAGAEVWVSVGKITVDEPSKAWETFGLQPHPRVKLLNWARTPRGLRDWKGGLFRQWLKWKMRKYRHRRPVFFLIDKGANFETILEIAKIRKSLNARIVLESHVCQEDYLKGKLRDAESDEERKQIEAGKWGRLAELEKEAVRAVDLLITVSENLRRKLCENSGRTGRSAVFRNGAMEPDVELKPLAEREGVVYVGHAFSVKGVDDLVQAIAKIPDAKLKIVGCRNEGEIEKVMGWARGSGIEDRLTITGFVPTTEVFEHLSKARVGVIPLKHGDGSPMKAFDYMAAGLPIVATDATANVEIIEESGAGVLVPARDTEAMANEIRKLLQDDELAEKHRQSGMQWISEHTWEKRGERILALLEEIESP